jgi:hypothetical protein
VTFLRKLRDEKKRITDDNIRAFLRECLGQSPSKELDWLCNCFSTGMEHYLEIEKQRRFFRLPLVLAEPTFVEELRRGPALRALRRIFLLCRVQRIVEDCLDEILTGKISEPYCFEFTWVLTLHRYVQSWGTNSLVNEDAKPAT